MLSTRDTDSGDPTRQSADGEPEKQLADLRTLVVGASSGIGREFALAARAHGARVAVAARRTEVINELAAEIGGCAYQLDVSDPVAIKAVVDAVAATLGGIDVVFFSSGVVPFARVEHVDADTWTHAFAVNAIGPALVIRAALPHLSRGAVIVVASSAEVGHPRAGTAPYSASKAALDEILRSWRGEHPELAVIRVAVGHTADTEILRGADRDLLSELYPEWETRGQVPKKMSRAADVATAIVSVIAGARNSPTVVSEVVQLAPRHQPRG